MKPFRNTDPDGHSFDALASPTVSDCNGSWTSLGGVLTSQPGAVEATGDTYSVFVRGSDRAVWGRNHTSAGWGGWYRTGGALLPGTGPSAAYHALWYHHQFLRSASGWHSPGGVLTTGIGAFAYNSTPDTFTLAAYALGRDSQVWQHTGLASGAWSKVTP